MDAPLSMKAFILATNEYVQKLQHPSKLRKHLDAFATAPLNIFDPSSDVTRHFFLSLHQLMNHLEPRSTLALPAISTLHNACLNQKARHTLTHTFKFIPILTKFLESYQNTEEELRLLHILSQLTYGVKITWQEAHLSLLVAILIEITLGKSAQENKTEALVALVNLCYKNLPVIYILMRSPKLKDILRTASTMHERGIYTCKLFVSYAEVNGPLPDSEILKFVNVVFNNIEDAFERRDEQSLRHTVDFFKDLNENSEICPIIMRYSSLDEDTEVLLTLLEKSVEDEPNESILTIAEFLVTVFNLRNFENCELIQRFVSVTSHLLHNQLTNECAVDIFLNVLNFATEDLPELTDALKAVFKEEPLEQFYKGKIFGAMKVLAAMAGMDKFKDKVWQVVDLNQLKSIFEHLISDSSSPISQKSEAIILLCLIAGVIASGINSDAYIFFLNNRAVLQSISFALIKGEKSIKCQALKLISLISSGTSGSEFLTALSMEMAGKSSEISDEPKTLEIGVMSADPVEYFASERRVELLLEKLNRLDVKDIPLSSVMELYEYKIASMRYTEQVTRAAMEAADAKSIGLNHQIAMHKGENERLHRVLLCQQQTIDSISDEKRNLNRQIDKFQTKIREFAVQVSELEKSLVEHKASITMKDAELKEVSRELEQSKAEIQLQISENETMKNELARLASMFEEISHAKASLEEDLTTAKGQINEYMAQIEDLQTEQEELKTSLAKCRDELNEKDELIADRNQQIKHLEHIREAVISVAARKPHISSNEF